MKKKKEESKTEKAMRNKKEKPYLTCTWYPDQCNAVGCDGGQGKCRDYKKD